MSEEEIKQLQLERDTAVFVAKDRLDIIERHEIKKEILELKYLKADKEIKRLNKIIQIKQNRINKLNKKLIRRDNIIEDLKAILKSKGYETYIPILEGSDKE